MIATAALANLAARLSAALERPVLLGGEALADQPYLSIDIHTLIPVPDVVKSTGRHVADQQTSLSWQMQLILRGVCADLPAALGLVEAAAADIESRPVLGADNWRADLALEVDADWARGIGTAFGLRLRVQQG